jgi:hypothetical protein
MMDVLQSIAYGIVGFAIIVVIGLVVLTKIGDSVATCATSYTYNSTAQQCFNSTGGDGTDPTTSGWVTSGYISTQLGSTGLSGWIPAVIAVAVGALFLSYFMGKKR